MKFIKVVEIVLLSLLMTLAYGKDDSQQDPVDSGWLPDLVGLPDEKEVERLSRQVADLMSDEQDKKCKEIDYNLRMVVFQNFVIYQHMANAQHFYFKEKMAVKYAHVLAMILQESSGDPTNVTDMSGRSISTSRAKTNLQRWNELLKLSAQRGIQFNYQTNFGLTQLSADRLFVAFKLAQDGPGKALLTGKYGDESLNKATLNTSIAIRRLIWLYQDFAQGRISQENERIHQEDIYKTEFNERYQTGLKRALLYCGTRFLFNLESQAIWANEAATFEDAIASIAYCKLGNSQSGYGKDEIDEQCFAEWVTLCPALNVNIALLTPLSYFQTRGSKPVCVDTFKRLLNVEPQKATPHPPFGHLLP